MPRSSNSNAGRDVLSARSRNVWGALVATLTVLGGALYAMDGKTSPRVDGLNLPALIAPATATSVEVVFNTKVPIDDGRWQAILIHHTGSPYATPQSLENDARSSGLTGLGYHFVIGNGNGLDDGELHVGSRWLRQQAGAHASGPKADWYNRNSIGICLVGNGDRGRFTEAQMRRLSQLVDAICRELNIPRDRIVLQDELVKGSGPGRFFPGAAFREQLALR
ncbi:MAG: N-acetylmuramoyl-L-alanine amidase [Phycisphaeraceae bacterium]|nr:N-acetylmuramoyl-L-alanine amidase [Phycisphaeraceae bacterium]